MEFDVGCYVRGAPSVNFNADTLRVSEVPVSEDWCPLLDESDELVSNVIKIESDDTNRKVNVVL